MPGQDPSALALVADIGGTNARFALVEGEAGAPVRAMSYPCADYPTLEDAVRRYLDDVGQPRPSRAAMAVATPLAGDRVQMTNHHWSFSVDATRARLELRELRVLNDFTALALSLPRLRPDELRRIGGGEAAAGTPLAVIGPGTGLGVSGLVPAGERLVPLQSEGGHVTYGAANRRETDLLAVIGRRYGGHVSAERLLSGPGLVNLYQAVLAVDRRVGDILTPAEITARGMADSDPVCREVLDTFCSMLGTAAGNLVLTLGARGGVYIGGGIVPKLIEAFARSPFRDSFEHRGRFSRYLAEVPSYVIMADHPALVGAAAAFAHPPAEVGLHSP